MFALGSLRSKLIVSHLAVVGLVFLLLVLVASVPIRRAQRRAEEIRLANVAQSLALQADFVTRPGATGFGEAALQALLAREADRSGVRILLADSNGMIVADSQRSAVKVGTTVGGLDNQIAYVQALAQQQKASAPVLRAFAPVAVTRALPRVDRRQAVVATTTDAVDRDNALYPVVLSLQPRLPVLDRYIRPLFFAALFAGAAGVGASLLLARSIARPISQLTATAMAIDAGNLAPRAEGEGNDEVGRLVHAFNAMVDRLTATYTSQRGLLANIAHELRTPLTSIQGYAQGIRDGVFHDQRERDDALRTISEESQRMEDLVNQILQLSRLESGQTPLALEPVDLGELLHQVGRSLAGRARDQSVDLRVESVSEMATIVDRELLRQAIGNLATNALRHTPSGGVVTLRAGRAATPGGGRAVRISVTDTGLGIPEGDLPHIFDRFYRGSPTTAGDSPGAGEGARRFGLGLSIAREVVAHHGGTISADSVPGSGTTFTIDLPADRGTNDASASDT